MRGYQSLIEESELLLLPPSDVCDWLKMRAEIIGSLRWSLNEDTDKALSQRADPLIDLGLARHTISDEIARELFGRLTTAEAGRRKQALALRLAVLANQALVMGAILDGTAGALFPRAAHQCVAWLNAAEGCEIRALFENPKIGDNFLCDFLEGEGPWNEVAEE